MSIYFVTTKQQIRDSRSGETKPFVLPFEAPHESVEELTEALTAGPITGQQIVYRHLPDGRRVVLRRIGYTLTANSYDTIQESKWHFVENGKQ